MKKSFMTRVLAVTLSTAMAFSVSSASNLVTASAAAKPFVSLKTKFKTLSVGQKYKMTLKNNSIKWRIQSATSSDKTIVKPYKVKPTYVKLKGKAEGRVKITYKLKTTQRKKNNTKTLKGTVQVKAAGTDNPSTTFSASATAADTTNVKVTFSQAIDTEGVTAENFAIDKDVTVREAKVSEDGKTVDLVVAGATYSTEYEVTVTGVKVAGEAKDPVKCKFTTPAAAEGYKASLIYDDKPIKSDGQTTRVFKFELRNPAGELVTDKGIEVGFETTLGNFAESRVVLDNGVAENTFRSQSLSATRTATITATVIAANDKDLLGQSVVVNLVLTPNPEDLADTSVGAIITNAAAPTADRVVAYFDKEVNVKDFQKPNGALDNSKFEARVLTGVGVGFDETSPQVGKYEVVGVMAVDGEPKALELLVNKPMQDNTTVCVEFKDKRNTSSVISSANKVYCKLTDGYQPSAYTVKVVNNHKLEIEFSEAVLRGSDATNYSTDNARYAADRAENYAIDTQPLTNWGVASGGASSDVNSDAAADETISSKDNTVNKSKEKGDVKVGIYRNGEDKRNIVTIELGEGKYLSQGQHSIAISNVGDWAAATDGWRNIINTATLQFTVPEDTQRPTFDLEVQSPEQYKLTASCDFEMVDTNATFKTPTSEETASVVKLQKLINGQWTTISDHAPDKGYNPIMVSRIQERGSNTNDYLVETQYDWTRVCDTRSTHENYYTGQYRLYIAPNSIRNVSNGLTNEAIEINLSNDAKMQKFDDVYPVISSIEQGQNANGDLTENYHVTFSEPVKLNTSANKEGITPTQGLNDNQASLYSAYFVKKDSTQKTVQAKIDDQKFLNAEDTMIKVTPTDTLDAGDWDLFVRGASDDVGNTSPTSSGTITVTRETVASDFKVVWAAVSSNGKMDGITSGKGNYIFVKFNRPISVVGGAANVGNTANYTLNGNNLPAGSNITAHIAGYDDHITSRIDSITISLPNGSNIGGIGANTMDWAVSGQSSILTISSAVTSWDGIPLSAESGYNLPYQYGVYQEVLPDNGIYNNLTAKNDAAWGNDVSEQYKAITAGITDPKKAAEAYAKAVKDALGNIKYRKVILTEDVASDLSIKRIVDLNLNGHAVKGNVTIETEEAANKVEISNTNANELYGDAGGVIEGNEKNEKGTASLTINTPYASVIVADNVKVKKNHNSETAMEVKAVYSNTLTSLADYTGDIVITGSNVGFDKQAGTITDGKIVIDTTGTVTMKGKAYNNETVEIDKEGKLVLTDMGATAPLLKIKAKVAKTIITVKADIKNAANITIIAMAPGIEVRRTDPKNQGVTLKRDGGDFKQTNENGETIQLAGQADTTATGAEAWFSTLTVIDEADVPNKDGIEVVTVSAISGGSFFNDGDNIAKYITEGAKAKTEKDAENDCTYSVESVVPTVRSSDSAYIGYSDNKLQVKEAAKRLTYQYEAEVSVAIKVKDSKTLKERTITRKIIIIINPAAPQA